METKVNYAVVGAFVLVLGAAIVAGVLWIATGGDFQKKYDLYLAISEESVGGLNLNAPVKYLGVDVGKVRSITLDPENQQRVRLVFAIERGTPIKVDTVAVLTTQGLTGIAYVELNGGDKDSPPLRAREPGELPTIPTQPSLSARLENVLTKVLAKLDSTSRNVDAILSDENRRNFSTALNDIARVARAISAREAEIDRGIASAATTLENSVRLSAQLQPAVAQISRSAVAIENLGTEATRVIQTAGQSVESTSADLARFSAQTLPEISRLMDELNELAASMRRVAEQTERSPNGLIFGRRRVPDGPGEAEAAAEIPQ